MSLKIFVAGQRSFGAAVFQLCRHLGHDVVGVAAPIGEDRPDRLRADASRAGVACVPAGMLTAETLPACAGGVDLIVAAHSHDFIGRRTRGATRLGAIGYHPSLLPRHRGRDAIEWTIRMGERVAGGSVYWLSDGVDAGDIAAQEHCFVRPDDDARELWRRDLFPLGLKLFGRVLGDLDAGRMVRIPQRHELASWEPSIGRPPLFKPELPQIGMIEGFEVIARKF